MQQRIGVFGGTFDPIHYGHLIMAEQCREQLDLNQVLFVPARQSPFKTQAAAANGKQRLQMIELAIAGHLPFDISDIELNRAGPSYTVDTLAALQQANSDAQLFFMMGSDSLAAFPRWHQPEQIVQLAIPAVVQRPGSEADLEVLRPLCTNQRWQEVQSAGVQSRLIDLSSRDIRARVANGRSIRFMTPRAVEAYIDQHKIYAPTQDTT